MVVQALKDFTVWDPIKGRSSAKITPRMMAIHTAVTNGLDIYGPFTGPGGTYAHFYNPKSGRLRQHQEINRKAFADLDGNSFIVSVEHWDGYPSGAPGYWKHGSDVPPLTESQVENDAMLFAYLVTHFGVPNRVATPDNLTGLGWHRLGIRGNFPAYDPKDRKTWTGAQSGARFSTAYGKVCPGDRRIDQVQDIFDRAQVIMGKAPARKKIIAPAKAKSTAAPASARWPTAALPVTDKHTVASHSAWVKLLSDVGYRDKDLTVAFQKWLRKLGYYSTKYLIDGSFGPATVKALQSFLRAKGLYTTAYLIDGVRGPATVRAEIAYLNQQRLLYK